MTLELEQRFNFRDRLTNESLELDIKHDGKAVHWVLPGQRARFNIRAKCVAYRIDQFIVDGEAAHWRVLDIKVHGQSQLRFGQAPPDDPQDDGIPGGVFTANNALTFATLQTAMTLTIEVMYVGPNPEGQPFACTALCSVAR